MANISQNVNIEMLEKLPDGTYKRKYPKTRADDGTTFDEHLAEIATLDKLGHVKAETDEDGKLILDVPKSNYNAIEPPSESDDETEGYSAGSVWVYSESELSSFAYICLDNTPGKAQWMMYASTDGSSIVWYSSGIEYVSFNGKVHRNGTASDPGIADFSKEVDHLYIRARSSSGTSGISGRSEVSFSTEEIINFANINELFIDWDITTPYREATITLELIDVNGTRSIYYSKIGQGRQVNSIRTSNLLGSYRIRVYVSASYTLSNSQESIVKIYKIWGV